MSKIGRALISVHDKSGVVEFAAGLAGRGVELLSTGGTARVLREGGLDVREVSDWTSFPEMLDGRVKTLHPRVHGGLLFRRDLARHVEEAAAQGIEPIDLVAVNLYPFEGTVARPGVEVEEAVEQIDIGGPSMLRSAAKNWASVTVVVDPADYALVLDEIAAHDGETYSETRLRLARKAFSLTCGYDAAIANFLGSLEGAPMPRVFHLQGRLLFPLRYGENPHQEAAFYGVSGVSEANLAKGEQVHGKELSYNNILDLASALELVKDFPEGPCACVIKHNNPCGAGVAEELAEAFEKAYAGDPQSAFGGVVGLNQPVDGRTARRMTEPDRFIEAVVAPEFDREGFDVLTRRPRWGKNVRLVRLGSSGWSSGVARFREVRWVVGGVLVQSPDRCVDEWAGLKVVTRRAPEGRELEDLKFAQRVCKHVKSNAIVLAKDGAVIGVGAGQMSRVDSVVLAVGKAGARTRGAVMASDAFFPFPDGVKRAAESGVRAVIQPGGSLRDGEVIEACDRLDLAMVTTGIRHFRH